MSIRVYSVAPELDGSTGKKLKACRLNVVLCAYRNGKRTYRRSKLNIVGQDDAGLLANMVLAVEAITSCSKGKVVSVELEMGHYRHDETLAEITGKNSAGSCKLTTIDGHKMKIYIPFCKDMLRADMEAKFAPLCATDKDARDAKLGFVRWNGAKTALETDQALITNGASSGETDQVAIGAPAQLVDAPGIADYYLGDADNA